MIDSLELTRARDLLLGGDVVAVPTETVYGLAASIESEAGLRRVFALKERPFFDPLIVHVASLEQARALVTEWPPLADFLARWHWPGPLTIVLPKAEHVNSLMTSGLNTVAIRYPAHPLALDLIGLLGHPIAAPSANRFGRTSPSRAEHVRHEFPGVPLLVLDGGDCEVGIESTVISFGRTPEGHDRIEILRPGGISIDELRATLARWSQPVEITTLTSQASPGHLKHHYMPDVPLVIVSERSDLKTISLALGRPVKRAAELVLDEDPAIAARELYAQMRELSASGCDVILVRVQAHQTDGLWAGIWDRLSRAASLNLLSALLKI